MSRLIKCPSCGGPVSSRAAICPQCEALIKKKKAKPALPCRVCGFMLDIDTYRNVRVSTATHLYKGTTQYSVVDIVTHKPCPKCGEPKPLRIIGDTILGKLILYPLILGCGIPLGIFLAEIVSHDAKPPAVIFSILFAPLFLGMLLRRLRIV